MRTALDALLCAAHSAHPHEACGILLGRTNRITGFTQAANVHPTPETHFEIDPQVLIDVRRGARGGGPEIIGYFHSHPNGPARPSATDRALAPGDGRIWAIAGADDDADEEGDSAPRFTVTFWRDDIAGFTRLSYALVSG